ncbi:hypothetical protein SAMN05660976_02995 [Nonomuraea pusilla]|uniref:Uncharacterized protein n=1 Tax=Nonomuraea pusilla TaxID=46177 RepID=A0A1H7S058_9ACTN|nr:hypothetical protein SAMN05660976_02995 [Nonomuraea pusilla]
MADRRGMVRGVRPGSRTGMEITRTCTYTLRKLPTRDLALSPSSIFAVAHPRYAGHSLGPLTCAVQTSSAPFRAREDGQGTTGLRADVLGRHPAHDLGPFPPYPVRRSLTRPPMANSPHPSRITGPSPAPYLRRSDVLGAFPCPGRRTRHHGPASGCPRKASGSRPRPFPPLPGPQISHKASHGELTAPLPHHRPLPGPLPAPFRRPRRLSVSPKTDKALQACERMSPEGIRLTASALSLVIWSAGLPQGLPWRTHRSPPASPAPCLRPSDVLGAFPCPRRRTRHHGPASGCLPKASGSRPRLFPSLPPWRFSRGIPLMAYWRRPDSLPASSARPPHRRGRGGSVLQPWSFTL